MMYVHNTYCVKARTEFHCPPGETQPALRVDIVNISNSTDMVNNHITWEQKSLMKSQ